MKRSVCDCERNRLTKNISKTKLQSTAFLVVVYFSAYINHGKWRKNNKNLVFGVKCQASNDFVKSFIFLPCTWSSFFSTPSRFIYLFFQSVRSVIFSSGNQLDQYMIEFIDELIACSPLFFLSMLMFEMVYIPSSCSLVRAFLSRPTSLRLFIYL